MELPCETSNSLLNSQFCICSIQEHHSQGQSKSADAKLIWCIVVLPSVVLSGQRVSGRCVIDIAHDSLPDFILLALLDGVSVLLTCSSASNCMEPHIPLFFHVNIRLPLEKCQDAAPAKAGKLSVRMEQQAGSGGTGFWQTAEDLHLEQRN